MYRIRSCYQALVSHLVSAVSFEIGLTACFDSIEEKEGKRREEKEEGEE